MRALSPFEFDPGILDQFYELRNRLLRFERALRHPIGCSRLLKQQEAFFDLEDSNEHIPPKLGLDYSRFHLRPLLGKNPVNRLVRLRLFLKPLFARKAVHWDALASITPRKMRKMALA